MTEYEKDLNELKEQILKEGNTLLTKRALLERFCEIDKEYNGEPWNLLQILYNINVLIGQEPCEEPIKLIEQKPKKEYEICNYTIQDDLIVDGCRHKPIASTFSFFNECGDYKFCPYCGREIEVEK